MKKIITRITSIILLLIAFSCADNTLDPLQFDFVKKGAILALRGTQLDNIYFQGKPGAELFPKIATGAEKFEFDAEFLAEDPSTLESFDIYVIKGVGSAREKVLVKNVSASEFKTTSDYRRPWVSVSMTSSEILNKLGISFPLSVADINTLLTTYKFGVNLEMDLNLKDGTKVLASDLVASGLFQSNQFYPAQKLTYAMTDYCSYNSSSWAGTYGAREVYEAGVYPSDGSLYTVNLTQDPSDPNKFFIDNFWDYGLQAYVVFSASVDPSTQVVVFPDQDVDGETLTSVSGSYDQCLGTFQIQTKYGADEWRYEFTKQ